MDNDIKERWVTALRSGEYRQGRGSLHPDADTYCCLGVLCSLHRLSREAIGTWGGSTYYGETNFLPKEVQAWSGIEARDPEVGGARLSLLNDGNVGETDEGDVVIRPHTFAEIADLIEQHL
jgi:hypothetical protein